MGWILFIALVAALVGYSLGWSDAHRTVARECERLGSFYVGSKTFRCSVEDAGRKAMDAAMSKADGGAS